MTSSAVILWAAGIILSFVPDLVLTYFSIDISPISLLFIQIIGALYFGFGMLNWMSKGGLIGGIYNRPIAVANLSHFMIAGFTLIKSLSSHPDSPPVLWGIGIIYCIFGVSFGIILFRHPIADKK